MRNSLNLYKKAKHIVIEGMYFSWFFLVVFHKNSKETNSMYIARSVQSTLHPTYFSLTMAILKSLEVLPRHNSLCKMERLKYTPLQEPSEELETMKKIPSPQNNWQKIPKKTANTSCWWIWHETI